MRVLLHCIFCTYLFSYQCYCGCSCKGSNGNNDQKGELNSTNESVIRLKIDKNLKLYNDKEEEIKGDDKLHNEVISPISGILKNFNHQNRNIINLLKYVFHEDEKDSKTEGGEKEKSEEEKKKEEEEKNAKGAFLKLAEENLKTFIDSEDKRDNFLKIFMLKNLPNEKIYELIVEDIMGIVNSSSTLTLKEIFDYLVELKLPSDFYFNLYEIGDDMIFLLSKSTYEFARTVINSKFFNNIDNLEQIINNLISILMEMGINKDGDTTKNANFYCRAFAYILCNFIKPIINGFAFLCNIKGHGEYYLIYIPKQVCEYFGKANIGKIGNFIDTFIKKNKETYDIIFNDKYIFEINDNKRLTNINKTKMADIYIATKNPNKYSEFKFKYDEKNNNSSSTDNSFKNEETVLCHEDIRKMSEYLNMNPQDLINEIKNIEIQSLDKFINNRFMNPIKKLYSNMVSNCNTAQMILNNKLKIDLSLKTEEKH